MIHPSECCQSDCGDPRCQYSPPKLNCFELGEREKYARERRIANALEHGSPGHDWKGERELRHRIADVLYHARYDGRAYWEVPSEGDVLEAFCFAIFGAGYEEVLEAWDRFLG